MELEAKHIIPYFPHKAKLKGCISGNIYTLTGIKEDGIQWEGLTERWDDLFDFILVLRPMSDLTKPIEHNGERFTPDLWFDDKDMTMYFEEDFLRGITRRNTGYDIMQCSYNVIEKLFEWHFNVFNLPQELWVNYNDVEL